MTMTFRLGLAAAVLVLSVPVHTQDKTQTDRAAAIKHLEVTRQAFLNSIAGVSEEQWKFKAGPDRWSIAEVAEHIAISEDTIFQLITTQMLKAPAPSAPGVPDDKVIAALQDRTQKFQAPEMLKPVNRWASKADLIKAFETARTRNIEWTRTTAEDLRAHAFPHPALGPLDVHQWVLLLSAHSARHTAQIEEVKTQNGYPKSSNEL